MRFNTYIKNNFLNRFQHKREFDFIKLFKKFQNILSANNEVLEIIADMEDKLGGEYIFDRQYIISIYERLSNLVHRLVLDLNSMAPKKYAKVFNRFEDIHDAIGQEIAGKWILPRGDAVIPYKALSQDIYELVGNKNANLASVKNILELPVPDGFTITTSAFRAFLEHNGLQDQLQALFELWNSGEEASIQKAGSEIQEKILNGQIPADVMRLMEKAVRVVKRKYPKEEILFAVRSSAWGEDSAHSFAGQYKSVLNVPAGQIADAYKKVLASAYSASALSYQRQKGFQIHELAMAVGCLLMVPAKASGVIYTMDTLSPENDTMTVTAAWGLGIPVVEGQIQVDHYTVNRTPPYDLSGLKIVHKAEMMTGNKEGGVKWVGVADEMQNKPCLSRDQLKQLTEMALMIERYFKKAQDIEWAIDQNDYFMILQTRPLNITPPTNCAAGNISDVAAHYPVLMKGNGVVVQRGVAAGKVFIADGNEDFSKIPEGSILVAKRTSPRFAGLMRKVHGILTDVGSPLGHMATIAREFRVPTIVNTKIATQIFKTGDEITIDATQNVVYAGKVKELCFYEFTSEDTFEESYEYRLLRRMLKRISPLNLVDPHDKNFNPSGCKTFHDIIRFVHEKAVEELIYLGNTKTGFSGVAEKRLQFNIPLGLVVIDIGGGIAAEGLLNKDNQITPEDITSVPMKGFLEGLMEPGMWSTEPVSVDFGSFMSSLTRTFPSTAASAKYTGKNLAVVSKEYFDLSLKLGYHFNIIDAYISDKLNDNYAYFRFLGGVTDVTRRSRRAKFIGEVLEQFNFRVEIRGDLIVGRIKKLEPDAMVEKMKILGCLVAYARQLDILMYNDENIGEHVKDFFQRTELIRQAGLQIQG